MNSAIGILKRKRCGVCSGCIHISDCGHCVYCKDKPKFGGKGKLKQCCRFKKCALITSSTKSTQHHSDKDTEEQKQSKKLKVECVTFMSDYKDKAQPQQISSTSIDVFLQSNGRSLYLISGDGNCLFRAISFGLFGADDKHYEIRTAIVRLINLNGNIFSNFLIPSVNHATIEEHVSHMMHNSVWGTQVEIVAAATLFQIPVYVCSFTPTYYSWNITKPLPTDNIRIPELLTDELILNNSAVTHLELYYHGSHYDAITKSDDSEFSNTFPELTGTHSALVDLTNLETL